MPIIIGIILQDESHFLLHCHEASTMMSILESRPIAANETNSGTKDIDHSTMQRRVALVDGMAEIRGMEKPEWIKNCLHLDLNTFQSPSAKKVRSRG